MAYILRTDGTTTDIGWNPPYEKIRDGVGGWIEYVPTADGNYMYCHEEGKLLGLPVNEKATSMIDFDDIIVGDVVVMDAKEEEE